MGNVLWLACLYHRVCTSTDLGREDVPRVIQIGAADMRCSCVMQILNCQYKRTCVLVLLGAIKHLKKTIVQMSTLNGYFFGLDFC